MEALFASLNIGPQMGLCFFLMVCTVGVVNLIKRLLTKAPWKWTASIPDETWWVLSIAIPVGVCIAFNWDFIETIVGEPVDGLAGKFASAISGTVVGLAGQTSYGAKKAAKSLVKAKGGQTTEEYTPGGPFDTVVVKATQKESTISEAPSKPAALPRAETVTEPPLPAAPAPPESTGRLCDETHTNEQQVPRKCATGVLTLEPNLAQFIESLSGLANETQDAMKVLTHMMSELQKWSQPVRVTPSTRLSANWTTPSQPILKEDE